MSKYNNRRNSNSNLGELCFIEKDVAFNKDPNFDERLNIYFLEDNSLANHTVTVEAPEKVAKFIKVNSQGITIKSKQYANKNINITVKGCLI